MHRTLPEYRTLARQLVEYAVNGTHGRGESDPVYRVVTEGRDPGTGRKGDISSCGFLPSFLWHRLGLRCPFVNRGENPGYGYRVGRNISLLCGPLFGGHDAVPTAALRTPLTSSRFDCGDVLVVWNKDDTTDAHTFVALEHQNDALLSGDYGQPGGKLVTRPITIRDVHDDKGRAYQTPFAGRKQIRRWIPLEFVLQVAEHRGELVEPDDSLVREADTERTPVLPTEPLRPTLRLGDTGAFVAELQTLLNKHLRGNQPPLKVDGLISPHAFGKLTREALIGFQRSRFLDPSGVCEALTWHELLKGNDS